MLILDGNKLAQDLKRSLNEEIIELKSQGVHPALSVILAGQDPASAIYVRNKEKSCKELGILSKVYKFPESVAEKEILGQISRLNEDAGIHGILVQLPLPAYIKEEKIIEAIDPKKDVDCFHPENVGRLVIGSACFYPCTPLAIFEILKKNEIKISGQDITIVGMSNIVGKPLAAMLINAGATVTACQAQTRNLGKKTLEADIVISAAGRAGLIHENMVKKNAVIVDVGMNRDAAGRLVGDVDFPSVSRKVSAITPVPGGVGPVTVAMLMKNTVQAAKYHLCNSKLKI